ncbi:unnamed protein product [Amoebophrya sp. A25]|nr:unnamed protein product [Amoebophrya sp. A25]|eukprot:GSA25T00010323001.1
MIDSRCVSTAVAQKMHTLLMQSNNLWPHVVESWREQADAGGLGPCSSSGGSSMPSIATTRSPKRGMALNATDVELLHQAGDHSGNSASGRLFPDALSDRVAYDSAKICAEAVLLLSTICAFWDPQMLRFLCLSTDFLRSYERVLENLVTRLRDRADSGALESHLLALQRFAIVVGDRLGPDGGAQRQGLISKATTHNVSQFQYSTVTADIHGPGGGSPRAGAASLGNGNGISALGGPQQEQDVAIFEFFSSRCVASLCAQALSEEKPLKLRRRAAETVAAIAALAPHSPLSCPHSADVRCITKHLCNLYLLNSNNEEVQGNVSDTLGLSAIHAALLHVSLASPAEAAACVRAVSFVPKLVKLIESLPPEIKLSAILKGDRSSAADARSAADRSTAAGNGTSLHVGFSRFEQTSVSKLNSSVCSLSTATAGGQQDHERLHRLTLHLRLLTVICSAHDDGLDILVERAGPDDEREGTNGPPGSTMSCTSATHTQSLMSKGGGLQPIDEARTPKATVHHVDGFAFGSSTGINLLDSSTSSVHRSQNPYNTSTANGANVVSKRAAASTLNAHHNLNTSYLLIVLHAIWCIAEAHDGFCLEVLDFLRKTLDRDGERHRVAHLLGPHSSNLVFNKMLLPHAMRGATTLKTQGGNTQVSQFAPQDRSMSRFGDQSYHRMDPHNDVTTTRALPSHHSSRLYATASKCSPISPVVYCRLMEVLSLSAPGLTTNKATLVKFVSFLVEFIKHCEKSKTLAEWTLRKCTSSLHFIASLHLCKATAAILSSCQQRVGDKPNGTTGPQLDFWFDLAEGREKMRLPVLRVLLAILVSTNVAKSFFTGSPRTLPILELCLSGDGSRSSVQNHLSSHSGGHATATFSMLHNTTVAGTALGRDQQDDVHLHFPSTGRPPERSGLKSGHQVGPLRHIALHILWIMLYQNQRVVALVKSSSGLVKKLEDMQMDPLCPDRTIAQEIFALLTVG